MAHSWLPRFLLSALGLSVVVVSVCGARPPATTALDTWFLNATSFDKPGVSQPISKPDFLGTSNWKVCAGDHFRGNPPNFYGVWFLSTYDTKHHIALARGVTDQCSLAIFTAPAPPQKVGDADLSQYGTVRGLRIGSPYSKVLALYGPPEKHGSRFVTSYSALVPANAYTRGNKHVELPERITLVIADGRVDSISIFINESNLY